MENGNKVSPNNAYNSDSLSILNILESGFSNPEENRNSNFSPHLPNFAKTTGPPPPRRTSKSVKADTQQKSKTAPSSPKNKSKIEITENSETDSNEVVKKALEHKPLKKIPFFMYDDIFNELKNLASDAKNRKNLREGVKIQLATEYVQEKYENDVKQQNQSIADDEYQTEIDEYKNDLAAFDAETERQIDSFMQKKNMEKIILDENHENEVRNLQNLWSSPAKQRMFNRASNALVHLRRLQKDALERNDFVKAMELQKFIKRRETQEIESNSYAIQNAYDECYKKLKEKQKKEDDMFQEQFNNQLMHLKQSREKLRRAILFRRQKIKLRDKPRNQTLIRNRQTDRIYSQTEDFSLPLYKRAMYNKYTDITSIVLKPLVFKNEIRTKTSKNFDQN